ncbi:hypothetical protein PVAND_015066 [Polypedilum vanderplanki]|uniref:C2H2-type domain-containing protein n=1 Tax=Polypedilum vanderplanki TaxID=319348 RepID=A0A9J6BBJ0_POLVA|nr:hypothetical protein PVAND_015066 [Polypedilum vanderplanki]
MAECILCLTKVTKTKSIKLSEKINESMTLSEAIREHLTCGTVILSQKPPAQQFSCSSCFNSFKSFYDFLTKITNKHPQSSPVKAENSDKSSLTIVNINEPQIEFQDLNSNVKIETEVTYDDVDAESEVSEQFAGDMNRFDDSDFEWSMDEDFDAETEQKTESKKEQKEPEEAPVQKRETRGRKRKQVSDVDENSKEIVGNEAKKTKRTRKTRKNEKKSEELDTSLVKSETEGNENQPKVIKNENSEKHIEFNTGPVLKKARSKSGYIRYLKHSQITQEIIDSGLKYIVIAGIEYKVPKVKEGQKLREEADLLEKLEKRLQRDPNRRLHPSLDPEGEEKIRRFMDIKCYICAATFDSFFRLNKHFKLFHPNNRAYLTCCGKNFNRRFELLNHIEYHDKSVIYKCEECNKIYKNKSCLRAHRKQQHEQPKTGEMCAICGGLFSSNGALKAHMLMHIVSDRTFECYICKKGKTYKNEHLLRKHMNTRHNFVKPDNMTVCHICSSTFRESHLAKHMSTVHSDEDRVKVQCKICGFWLLEKTMRTHLAKHNDQGVTCGECGKFLKSKYSLKGHMKQAHSDDYKFICKYCQKGFHKENKMIEHVAVKHTRDFPFKCRVLSCQKGFRAEANWRIHERKAHPEEYEAFFKPFYKRNPNELIGEGF